MSAPQDKEGKTKSHIICMELFLFLSFFLTSSSDTCCKIEDKLCGSVVIRNPFSFMMTLATLFPLIYQVWNDRWASGDGAHFRHARGRKYIHKTWVNDNICMAKMQKSLSKFNRLLFQSFKFGFYHFSSLSFIFSLFYHFLVFTYSSF